MENAAKKTQFNFPIKMVLLQNYRREHILQSKQLITNVMENASVWCILNSFSSCGIILLLCVLSITYEKI